MERRECAVENVGSVTERMKRVFVTGGTGLVGSHVIEEVLRVSPEAHVFVLVYECDPQSYYARAGLRTRVTEIPGDIRNASLVTDAITQHQIDTVFHLAAQPIVTTALEQPLETWQTNLMGTVHVMEAVRRTPSVRSVIVASSDKAYGDALFQPYTEVHPLNALHPYDTSKACTDMIARAYARCYGLPVLVTRFGNIYGPGDLHFDRLVPGAMRAVATGETLDIRSDGTPTRDYVYVKDVARTYVLLAPHAKAHAGAAFNCTSGIHRSVKEMLQEIGRVVGTSVPYRIVNTSTHEIPDQALADNALRLVLGNDLPRTSLEQALRETGDWYYALFAS
jgi:CDP-glucose 4,6-dehydratase